MPPHLPPELLRLILSELGTSLLEKNGASWEDAKTLSRCCLASKGLLDIARPILYGARRLDFWSTEVGAHVRITDYTLRQSLARLKYPHLHSYTRALALNIDSLGRRIDLHLLPVVLLEALQSSPSVRLLQIQVEDGDRDHRDALAFFVTEALSFATPPLHTFIHISTDNKTSIASPALRILLHSLPHLKVLRLDRFELTVGPSDNPPRFTLRSLTLGNDLSPDPKHTLPYLTGHSTTSLSHLAIHDNTTTDNYDLAPLSSLTALELGMRAEELDGSLTALQTLSSPSLHTFIFTLGREPDPVCRWPEPICISRGTGVLEAIPRTAKVVKVQAELDSSYLGSFMEHHRDELEWQELCVVVECPGSHLDSQLLPLYFLEALQDSPNIRELQIELNDFEVDRRHQLAILVDALSFARPPLTTFIHLSTHNQASFSSSTLKSLLHSLPLLKVLQLDRFRLTVGASDDPPRFSLRSLTLGSDISEEPKHTLPFLTAHSTTSLRHLAIHDNVTTDDYDLSPLTSLAALELGMGEGEYAGSLTALKTLSAPSLHTFVFSTGQDWVTEPIGVEWKLLEAIPRTAKVVKIQGELDNGYLKDFRKDHRGKLQWKELWPLLPELRRRPSHPRLTPTTCNGRIGTTFVPSTRIKTPGAPLIHPPNAPSSPVHELQAASMSTASPDFNNILGPFATAALVDTFLCGVVLVQAQNYFSEFSDARPVFWTVVVLSIISLVHTVTIGYSIYDRVVLHFGDLSYLPLAGWSFDIGCTLTGLTTLIVQAWYAWRVFIISGRSKVVPVLILACSLLSFGFAIGSTIAAFRLKIFPRFNEFTYGVLIWLIAAIVSDFLITVSLVYHLGMARQSTVFEQTKSLLYLVARNVVENNLLTAMAALVDAALFGSGSAWHITINSFLAKFYFMSLLASRTLLFLQTSQPQLTLDPVNSRSRLAEAAKKRPNNTGSDPAYPPLNHQTVRLPSKAATRPFEEYP
ncbi:hypothetical protein RQP46_010941 [Phenoliferia psychrophenolica]